MFGTQANSTIHLGGTDFDRRIGMMIQPKEAKNHLGLAKMHPTMHPQK
jgi:molecular chaperone DnaK (HSP70)